VLAEARRFLPRSRGKLVGCWSLGCSKPPSGSEESWFEPSRGNEARQRHATEPPLASNVPSNKQASRGWRWAAGRRPNWLISRRWALVFATLRRLISVRSVVQLYPGPFCEAHRRASSYREPAGPRVPPVLRWVPHKGAHRGIFAGHLGHSSPRLLARTRRASCSCLPRRHRRPGDQAGHKKQDARCRGWNVQDEEVCGERAKHDGRDQRGSNSPRLRHHDQYGSGELEDARDVPQPLSKPTATKSATISGVPVSFAQAALTNTSARNAWTHHNRVLSGRPLAAPRAASTLADVRLVSALMSLWRMSASPRPHRRIPR
jgi:hypothetical protein